MPGISVGMDQVVPTINFHLRVFPSADTDHVLLLRGSPKALHQVEGEDKRQEESRRHAA